MSREKKKKGVPSKYELMVHNRSGAQYSQTSNFNKLNPVSITTGKFLFGKHKGCLLSEVPLNYLKWAVNNIPLSTTGKSVLSGEIKKRLEN